MQSIRNRRQNILLVIFASLGILGLLIRSIYLVVTGFLSFDPGFVEGLASSLLSVLSMLICASVLLPMLVLSLKTLRGQAVRPAVIPPIKSRQLVGLVLVWVVIIILGSLIPGLFNYGWVVAVVFFLPGIGLPILLIVWIGSGGLPSGSVRRLWSVYGISMLGSTLGAVLLEYLFVGVALGIIGIAATANPELLNLLNQIKSQVTSADTGDIQSLVISLAPYLTNPLVILSILVFVAVLTPMIEETLKPAVLWLLGKRMHSPAEGFLLGTLCGAGFATMEGLLAASSASQMWGLGQAGRVAASLMHITASGILGWGIASAQLKKRYGRLVLAYLMAVSIHGLWNGSVVLAIYGSLRMVTHNMQVDLFDGTLVIVGLASLFIILIIIGTALPLINHRLRRSALPLALQLPLPLAEEHHESSSPGHSDIIAPPTN